MDGKPVYHINGQYVEPEIPGPGCSKHRCSAKASHIFSTKNIGIFQIFKKKDNNTTEPKQKGWGGGRGGARGRFVTTLVNLE